MAVTDAYATAVQYRTVTGKTDTAQDADILIDLRSISRYLDGKLERFFTKDTAAVERIYVPGGVTRLIFTDDIVSVAKVEVDTMGNNTFTTELDNSDYELLPLNAGKGPEPHPYTKLKLTEWGTMANLTPRTRVKITGVFGWPEVPKAIERATIHLTAILRLESPRATRRIAELGDVMEASPDAMSIIRQLTDRYKRMIYV